MDDSHLSSTAVNSSSKLLHKSKASPPKWGHFLIRLLLCGIVVAMLFQVSGYFLRSRSIQHSVLILPFQQKENHSKDLRVGFKQNWTADMGMYHHHHSNKKKIIFGATKTYGEWEKRFDFEPCRYKNCVVITGGELREMEKADMVLFRREFIGELPRVPPRIRRKQIWVVENLEPPSLGPAYSFPPKFDGVFNVTMTYRRDSEFYYPYYWTFKTNQTRGNSTPNYAATKVRGAFAYVSNCDSHGYDRLKLMKALRKYIDVDVFGDCTGTRPCPRMQYQCEKKVHSQYRFFLAFENSLCRDYITEKFWARLASDGFFVPVVVGGQDIKDYTSVAPPNSFIHVYNFSSLEQLGSHLHHLMVNDTAYNQYHVWRREYSMKKGPSPDMACYACQIANEKPVLPGHNNLYKWWDNDGVCRQLKLEN